MIPFFSKKSKRTIFEEFHQWEKSKLGLEDYEFQNHELQKDHGEYELAYVNKERILDPVDADQLDTMIFQWFTRELDSPKKMDDFFCHHKALDYLDYYLHWQYLDENMANPPFKGLSLYLMQQSYHPETVKFGILLGHFYDVMATGAAVKTIELLGKWPAFTYYGIEVMKELPHGQNSIFEMSRDTFGNGKTMIKEFVEKQIIRGEQ